MLVSYNLRRSSVSTLKGKWLAEKWGVYARMCELHVCTHACACRGGVRGGLWWPRSVEPVVCGGHQHASAKEPSLPPISPADVGSHLPHCHRYPSCLSLSNLGFPLHPDLPILSLLSTLTLPLHSFPQCILRPSCVLALFQVVRDKARVFSPCVFGLLMPEPPLTLESLTQLAPLPVSPNLGKQSHCPNTPISPFPARPASLPQPTPAQTLQSTPSLLLILTCSRIHSCEQNSWEKGFLQS